MTDKERLTRRQLHALPIPQAMIVSLLSRKTLLLSLFAPVVLIPSTWMLREFNPLWPIAQQPARVKQIFWRLYSPSILLYSSYNQDHIFS